MILLGAHMSVAGGVTSAFERAGKIGINTMQIFTKNQNRWQQAPAPESEVRRWAELARHAAVAPVVSHAAYLINLGTPDPALWERSVNALIDELQRAEQLDLLGAVLHPGAHMGAGEEEGIAQVARALDLVHAAVPGLRTKTLLETTAGQGTSLGHTFEQFRAILERVREPERVAFCADTCHLFAAGYELRTPEGYAETMQRFDEALGLDRLLCFHFNDSKKGLGSHVDRHDHIGSGQLGLEAFRNIMNDPRLERVPKILETPKSDDMHEDLENIERLKALVAPLAAASAADVEAPLTGAASSTLPHP